MRVSRRRLVAVAGVLVVAGAIAWPQPPGAFGTQLSPPFAWPGSYDDGAFVGVTVRFRPAGLPLRLSQRPLVASLRTVVDNSTAQSIWSVSPADAPDTALTLTVHRMTEADQVAGIAGVPVQIKVRLCPGYAPTTYFLGLTAYQGSKPLNQRLQIKMQVDGDAAKIKPLPEGAKDPCAG